MKWIYRNQAYLINNISFLFSGCSSLKELPDISKWNLNNVNNISELFYGCSSLKELPEWMFFIKIFARHFKMGNRIY